MRIWASLIGSSLLAICGATSAQAAGQTADAQDSTVEDENVATIVVTANRREEKLQEVPVTVTLVKGEQLTRQNVNTVEDLSRTAPALNTAGPSGFGAISIRGIGGLSFSRSSEGSVGVVVDGVSLANMSTNPPLLFDVARVEVLEGPQGTLFGRNSSAGVLNIITNAPNPDKFELIAHADVGSRDNYIGRAAVNLPMGSTAALRVTGSYSLAPKIQKNLIDGTYMHREAIAGRARFLWNASDAVTVNLSADYNDSDVDGGVPWGVYASSPTSLLTARLAACGVKVGPENEEGCNDPHGQTSSASYGFSGQVDADLGAATLTSITSYRASDGDSTGDVDSTSANRLTQSTADTIRNFSQELRISSPTDQTVEYVGGLYYFHSSLTSRVTQLGALLADLPLIGACPAFLPSPVYCSFPVGSTRPVTARIESYAAFGQVTIHATDQLRLILGARLGHEAVSAISSASSASPGAVFEFAPASALSLATSDDYFSYRIGAQYDVSKDFMVFATFTRGYKGPAVNDGASSAATPLIVRPEIPKSGEVGFKATLAGGRAAFNATAFYTEVTDFQSQFWDPSIPAFIFGNAPKLTSKGFSANFFGQPLPGLSTNIGVSYNDAKYGAGYLVADYLNVTKSAEGRQLVGSAKWKITASAEYTASLGGGMDGFIQADMVYKSRTFSNAMNDAILSTPGAAIFGGRIGIRANEGQFGISVFARNIFDTFRPTAKFATPAAAQQLDPLSFSQFSGPEAHRLIGVSLDAKF